MNFPSEDSRAVITPDGPGERPVELAPGRPAAEAGSPRLARRGLVPGGVAPGTAAPPHGDPPRRGGAATSPAGGTRPSAVLPAAWQRHLETFDDGPLPSLRLRTPEPPDEAAL